ncbi:MAG: alpha/beta hydrolase [Paludibacteraceae bacterium]|nr:alpha/beta hydrolase [Paludibacteraceae bacterium]
MRFVWAFLFSFYLTFSLSAEGKWITLHDGAQIYYEEYGLGEVVFLLHGHTLDRRMWNEQVGALNGKWRVIVPDFRGYGLSSDPVEGVQFTYADDLIEMMDSLRISKAHVVGLSMGAYVAGDMLAMYPSRLISCMMVSGEICNRPGPSQPKTREERKNQQVWNIQTLNRFHGLENYKRNRVEQLMKYTGPRGEEIREPLTEMIMAWRAWQAQHYTCRVYYGRDAWKRLQEVKPNVPSLIIYGEKENEGRSRMLDYLPDAEQRTFKDCGHMVNMEQRALFNETLLKWLWNHRERRVLLPIRYKNQKPWEPYRSMY